MFFHAAGTKSLHLGDVTGTTVIMPHLLELLVTIFCNVKTSKDLRKRNWKMEHADTWIGINWQVLYLCEGLMLDTYLTEG